MLKFEKPTPYRLDRDKSIPLILFSNKDFRFVPFVILVTYKIRKQICPPTFTKNFNGGLYNRRDFNNSEYLRTKFVSLNLNRKRENNGLTWPKKKSKRFNAIYIRQSVYRKRKVRMFVKNYIFSAEQKSKRRIHVIRTFPGLFALFL